MSINTIKNDDIKFKLDIDFGPSEEYILSLESFYDLFIEKGIISIKENKYEIIKTFQELIKLKNKERNIEMNSSKINIIFHRIIKDIKIIFEKLMKI